MNGVELYWIVFFIALISSSLTSVNGKLALVVTLAGSHKLAQYFEWSCRSIQSSQALVDMIVIHESNEKIQNITCASNVHFIDLGMDGLSKVIVEHLIPNGTQAANRLELQKILGVVLKHSPQYLLEIKPMMGTLFASYLEGYSHWSYTDPDIIWGDLVDWIDRRDLETYDYLSFAKTWDAARLYLRGELTWHKNCEKVNNLWRQLKYFDEADYIMRISSASRLLLGHTSTGAVFKRVFHSPEGWYSQVVFRTPNITAKIVGRGFDDYFSQPVVRHEGKLHRCRVHDKLSKCIDRAIQQNNSSISVHTFPSEKWRSVETFADPDHCKMSWLPSETRYCVASPAYDKDVALVQDKQREVQLKRLGEVMLSNGEWMANDEKSSPRQVFDQAAFFHFRDWIDFVAKTQSVVWPSSNLEDCMVLYLRRDQAMAYEACSHVRALESTGANLLLAKTRRAIAGEKSSSVSEILSLHKRKSESGANVINHSRRSKSGKHRQERKSKKHM
eukprot:gene228-249_t